MNEPLMHATIALAARCADRDTHPNEDEALAIAEEISRARGLDRRDRDELLEAAISFAGPLKNDSFEEEHGTGDDDPEWLEEKRSSATFLWWPSLGPVPGPVRQVALLNRSVWANAASFDDAYALVIGVSAYQRVRPLPAVHDAQDVTAVLTAPARCGYPAAHVRVLLEEAATRAAILDALDELAARARPSSTVFVYFSGHGGAAPGGGERCYLMPVDAGWRDAAELEETAISGAALSARLRALAASRVTVVLDCCRAGGLAEAKDLGDGTPLGGLTRGALSPLAAGRGRAVLAAARADGLAYVTPGQRNGVFTRHLLDGLRGGASAIGGVIRICDLFHYVQERVAAEQPAQRPLFKAELEENYPIARASAAAVAPVAIPAPPDGLPYDVFLSYAQRDLEVRPWVERVLVPFLEGCGIKVCLERRDFALGRPRIREMERAVTSSRYTLAVFTPGYVEDGFTDFQALIAQHLSLETREPRLIPVLRRACKLELGTRMTSLLDLSRDEDVPAGLERLALALRERPHPRLDP